MNQDKELYRIVWTQVYENWPEPERQRHLLRLWIAPKSARSLPNYYIPRWGSTTKGDRGGIIVPGTQLSVELNSN